MIGFEALVRGPEGSALEGSALERPDALFTAAREAGRLGELDWWCRATAFRTALEGGLGEPWSMFVNVEPGSLHVDPPPDARWSTRAATGSAS